jgi:hypothetical protein
MVNRCFLVSPSTVTSGLPVNCRKENSSQYIRFQPFTSENFIIKMAIISDERPDS